MSARRHLGLGLLFLGVVSLLGYYTLFKTDVSLFGEKPRLQAYAENAGGLRKGAPVLYAGVRWGEVLSVVPEVDRPRAERVRILIQLDETIRLFDDFTAQIQEASVLGGVQLAIDPGTPGRAEIDLDRPLRVLQSPSVLASVAQLVEENRESIRNTITGIESVVANLNASEAVIGRLINDPELGRELDNAVSAFGATLTNAQELTDEIRGGRGTLGRLIYDPELFDDIKGVTTSAQGFLEDGRALVADARTGEGIVALLLNDADAAGDVRGTLDSVRSITEKIDRGDGTLSRLVNDGAVAQSLQDAANSVTDFVGGIREGDGTIARLFNDSRLYDNFVAFGDDLLDMTTAIREQRGTVGRLIYDDGVIRQLEDVFGTLQGSLEEAREAAPVSTFLGTLFLGF